MNKILAIFLLLRLYFAKIPHCIITIQKMSTFLINISSLMKAPMKISINLFIIFLFILYESLAMASHSSGSHSNRPELIKITDLRETAKLAQSRNIPILIMFGTDECPYCELLKEDFLIPMIISGDYTDKIIFREAHIASGASIIDFSGKNISIGEFRSRYKVTLFPSMIFVDSRGQTLTKKIIGITTPSLFGGTLDDSIDKALTHTKKKSYKNK